MRISLFLQVYRLRLLGDYHHSTRIAFVEFVMVFVSSSISCICIFCFLHISMCFSFYLVVPAREYVRIVIHEAKLNCPVSYYELLYFNSLNVLSDVLKICTPPLRVSFISPDKYD